MGHTTLYVNPTPGNVRFLGQKTSYFCCLSMSLSLLRCTQHQAAPTNFIVKYVVFEHMVVMTSLVPWCNSSRLESYSLPKVGTFLDVLGHNRSMAAWNDMGQGPGGRYFKYLSMGTWKPYKLPVSWSQCPKNLYLLIKCSKPNSKESKTPPNRAQDVNKPIKKVWGRLERICQEMVPLGWILELEVYLVCIAYSVHCIGIDPESDSRRPNFHHTWSNEPLFLPGCSSGCVDGSVPGWMVRLTVF